MLQRLAVQKFHHQKAFALILTNLMDSTDIGVVEGRRSAGFATEPLQRRWLESQVFRKKLNGNQAAEFGVLSLVDNPHPTTTKLLDDAVVRDGLANQSGETPIQATCRFSRKPLEMGFPGSRELVSGAAIRLKYITGDEIRFFAESAGLLRFLMGPFGPVVPSSLKEWSLIQVPDIRMPLPGSFFKLPVDDIFDWNLTAICKGELSPTDFDDIIPNGFC